MQTSKYGSSVFMTSPRMTSRRFWAGVPWKRLVTSAAIRGSNSTAIVFLAFSKIFAVKFPVPGPISRTTSLCLRSALRTILHDDQLGFNINLIPDEKSTHCSAIPGFFKTCWPISVFILKMLWAALVFAMASECALLRFWGFTFGILKSVKRRFATNVSESEAKVNAASLWATFFPAIRLSDSDLLFYEARPSTLSNSYSFMPHHGVRTQGFS